MKERPDERKVRYGVELHAELKIFQDRVLHQLARLFQSRRCFIPRLYILIYLPNMASFEDYDEFGNYIGADLDSDDEEELPQNQFLQPPPPQSSHLEGYDDEPMPGPGADEGALMEIDGSYPSTSQIRISFSNPFFLIRAFT